MDYGLLNNGTSAAARAAFLFQVPEPKARAKKRGRKPKRRTPEGASSEFALALRQMSTQLSKYRREKVSGAASGVRVYYGISPARFWTDTAYSSSLEAIHVIIYYEWSC